MSAFTRWWFRTLTSSHLLYNTCWEDPIIDKQLLELDGQSRVLMITSAGDNALSYLLDRPARIDCVDMNFRQTALLDLKLAFFRGAAHGDLFELFGKGKSPHYRSHYFALRSHLPEASSRYWDHRIEYFRPDAKGLYYEGLSGHFARLLNRIIDRKNLRSAISELIREADRNKRENLYTQIATRLWSGSAQYLWQWDGMLSLAGIPKEQKEAIGNLNEFMDGVFRKVFVRHSAKENYFWRLYLDGHYDPEWAPEYLVPDNFASIRSGLNSLHNHTGTITSFLHRSEEHYSHFVLLDHMDWLAVHDREQLDREWKMIFRRSQKGSKVLFRTAFPNPEFLPDWVLDSIQFIPIKSSVLEADRVSTYPGTYLAAIPHV